MIKIENGKNRNVGKEYEMNVKRKTRKRKKDIERKRNIKLNRKKIKGR